MREEPSPIHDENGRAPRAPAAKRQLVGELLAEGVERCLADGTREWVNPHHVIGFTMVSPEDGVALEPLEGQVVLVNGSVNPRGIRFPPVVYEAECPPAQMRSDWLPSKSGIRIERAGMGQVGPAFTVTAIERWTGFSVERRGDRLHVAVSNTFAEPLREVELIAHYEGCYGKPGTASERAELAVLAPGETLARDFAVFIERASNTPGRTTHRAFSVQLRAASESVAFDFDRRLSRAGVDIDCREPERP